MFLILVAVVGLVAWALHLMQQAVERREFSLMLAGCLVSAAAAATMSVYFLTSHCVGYLTHTAQYYDSSELLSDSTEWVLPIEVEDDWVSVWTDASSSNFDKL